MQHMVGVKLDPALGQGKFEHSSYSTSDQQTGRKGDFFVGDVAIHVTTAPGYFPRKTAARRSMNDWMPSLKSSLAKTRSLILGM